MRHHRRTLSRLVMGLVAVWLLACLLVGSAGAEPPDNGEPFAERASADAPFVPNPREELPEDATAAGVTAAAATDTYMFVAASGFTPYNSTMVYSYYGGGCVYRTSGTSIAEYAVQLPQGAIVKYMRLYFYDNDPDSNASVQLYTFDGKGGYTQIASASSSGESAAYRDIGSGVFRYPVDNVAGSLELRLNYGTGGTSDVRICGVRLLYEYSPLWATMLPYVEK